MMYDLTFNPTYFKVSSPTEIHSTNIIWVFLLKEQVVTLNILKCATQHSSIMLNVYLAVGKEKEDES